MRCAGPAYPKLEWDHDRLYLITPHGTDYEVPDDPVKILGLLAHLADKTWVDREFLSDAIQRIAWARNFNIWR